MRILVTVNFTHILTLLKVLGMNVTFFAALIKSKYKKKVSKIMHIRIIFSKSLHEKIFPLWQE